MPEHEVRTCKRGHPRIPENFYIRPSDGARQCRACRKLRKAQADAIYATTPKGRASRNRAQAKYEATGKGWEVGRRHKLKGVREATQAKLDALKREEAECLRSLEQATQTKSVAPARST